MGSRAAENHGYEIPRDEAEEAWSEIHHALAGSMAEHTDQNGSFYPGLWLDDIKPLDEFDPAETGKGMME